jgi:DNA-binding MarR family transcriptional regulator
MTEPKTRVAPSRARRPVTACAPAPAWRTDTGRQTLTPAMVGFRLLKLTNLMSRPFFAQFAREHAMSLTEWRAIVVLRHQPGSAAQDIAAATGLHPMNVSRAVIALRKAGLVEEARDPKNHRRVLLWLTPAGEALFETLRPVSEKNANALLDALSGDELLHLGQALDKLIARAGEIVASEEA